MLLSALALLAAGVRADDLGGQGFGVPTGPPWSEARDRLIVQLRPAKDSGAAGAIFRQDIPYTRTALVLEPESPDGKPQDVTLADALAWSKTGEELFELGIENLERRYPVTVQRSHELPRGVRLNLIFDQHPYAAGHAISIEELDECMGKKGSLVAVPNQHSTMCYPIESSRASHAYLAMVNLAAQVVNVGDDPIVPHVYWYHGGQWETQPVRIVGDEFEFGPTPAFEKFLKELPRDIHDPRKRRY